MKSDFKRFIARFTVSFLLVAAIKSFAAIESSKQPNFIVILGEGAGWTSTSVQMDERNPASKSSAIQTPNFERLAATGMRFANGYAASPRCTPSRAALFTGKSPAALHMTFVGMGRPGGSVTTKLIPPNALLELPESEITIGEFLKRAGYATAHFGKWHVGRVSPSRHGFDESDGPTNNGGPDNVATPNPKQALAITASGIDFVERQMKAGRPFYLQMSHYPNQEEKGGGGGDRKLRTEAAREETITLDKTIGQILDAIERLGLKGNTYIVYTTDHGTQGRNTPLTGGKGMVWEGGLRVPFLVAGPGIKAGGSSHVRVSATDLFPTFAELAGVKESLPKNVEGGSFAPLLKTGAAGTVKRLRDEFVVHFPHYDMEAHGPASAIYLGDFKLIRIYETGALKLFNVTKDFGEQHDLAKELPDKVKEMNQRLTDYLAAVNAQMPKPNPNFDPTQSPQTKRGGPRKIGRE